MSSLQRWLRQPQNVWARRVLFQVHLWVGGALGLYLLVISVSGSAVVFRREMARSFMAPTQVAITGPLLSEAALRERVQQANPGYEVTWVSFDKRVNYAANVSIRRPGDTRETDRRINPYTGADLGPSVPLGQQVLEWFVDLHDNLLAGDTGRMLNGVGGALLLVICLTGLVLWWPGTRLWKRRLVPRRGGNWRLFNWELHGAVGLWSLSLLLLWAVTGVYFGFPEMIEWVQNLFDPDLEDFERPGDVLVARLVRWHFGRFGGLGVRILWVLIGLAPAALFVTGGIMWWNRVWRKRAAATSVAEPRPEAFARVTTGTLHQGRVE